MAERNYRDAVHNMIRLDLSSSDGRLIDRLVDSREFQRLRRIRQLGLAYFAYQTAEHSRFTHSLGAYHLASRILERLTSTSSIDEADMVAVKAAALLHDIGHGPFSHVIESVLGFHHEDFTVAAVLSSETEVGAILSDLSPSLPGDVADIIRGKFRRMALGQIVSSQLDVDRMDYLLRDSMMTGVRYGVFDLEWVLKSIEIDEKADKLRVKPTGLYAVEDYLQARYYMFRQVYFHRTLRAAEAVLTSMVKRALLLFAGGNAPWFAAGTAFEEILKGSKLSLQQHLSLDDADFIFHIKRWRHSDDKILADLATRFIDRDVLKTMEIDATRAYHEEFVQEARKAVAAVGMDPEYYFVEDAAAEQPYFFYSSARAKPKDLIYISAPDDESGDKEISSISPAVRGLQNVSQIQRICFPENARGEIEKLYRRFTQSTSDQKAGTH